jgi:hypothetical protein
MSLRHYFRGNDGDIVEISDYVRLPGSEDRGPYETTMQAEEGSVGSSTVMVDDEAAALTIGGHRLFYSTESTATGSYVLAYVGYTADRDIHRGPFRVGSSRVWETNLVDVNSVLARRILTGSSANRPAETDVARMQWLFGTEEADIIDDITSLFDATGGVAMDAVDYRGQRIEDVANDCAQASGKNYFITSIGTFAGNFVLWYGFPDSTLYRSPIRLSNDLSDIDEVWTYAIAEDTRLKRDPSRVYSGVYLPFDGGGSAAVYVQDNDTALQFALKGRDVQMDGANIKTLAKANARALRYLGDLDEEEDRITTAVLLPAAKQGFIREGMAVQFKATHLPGYSAFSYMRVLVRTLIQTSEEYYTLKLELAANASEAASAICDGGEYGLTPGGTYSPLGDVFSDGVVYYLNFGEDFPEVPIPGYEGEWSFPEFGGGGGTDFAGDCAGNFLWFVLVGDGTLVVTTAIYGGNSKPLTATLQHTSSPAVYVVDSSQSGESGTTFNFNVSSHGGTKCIHFISITDDGGDCGGKWGFSGATWTPA